MRALLIVSLSALAAGCAIARAQPAADAGPTADAATDTDTAAVPDAATAAATAPATDTATVPATATAPADTSPSPAPAHTGPAIAVTAGASLQTDALWAGARVEYRGAFLPFFDVAVTLLFGAAEDYDLFRASLHARLVLSASAFRLYPIVGLGVHHARPIGELAEFCQRLDDGCTVTAVGMELGLGLSWRALGIDLYFATGDVPRFTGLAHATLEL